MIRFVRIPILLTSFATALAAQQPRPDSLHLVSAGSWQRRFAGGGVLNQRISQAATEYVRYAPIPRFALFDAAFPADTSEYTRLHGYAVLLVTAVCQDSAELPLQRVYLASDSGQVSLPMITRVLSRVDPTIGPDVPKTFGPYRVDALYLVPVIATVTPHQLLVDFATHRSGFGLARFTTEVPDMIRNLVIGPPGSTPPDAAILEAFVHREYPGFVVER